MIKRDIVEGELIIKVRHPGGYLLLYVQEDYPGARLTELRFYSNDGISQEFYWNLLVKGDYIKAEAILEHGRYMRMYKDTLTLPRLSPEELAERQNNAVVYRPSSGGMSRGQPFKIDKAFKFGDVSKSLIKKFHL